jgi:MFS family permease
MGRYSSGKNLLFSVVFLCSSIAFMIFFMMHINKVNEPIVDKEIFKGKPFIAANIFNFVYGAAIFGVTSFIPLYVVSVYGMSTLESGLIMTPRSLVVTLAGVVTSFSLLRWGYRWPMFIGTIIIAFSLVMLGIEPKAFTFLGMSINNITIVVVIMLFSGLGMGCVAPSSNNACMDLMPEKVAAITGVRAMFRTIGGAISIALISLLLENLESINTGFAICFLSMALLEIAVLPLVFAMPSGPEIAERYDI